MRAEHLYEQLDSLQPIRLQARRELLVESGMRPTMARLTLARKIASIILTMWKKGASFDPQQLRRQAV